MGDSTAGRGPAGMGIAAADVPWDRRYLQLEPPAAVHTFAEFGAVDQDVLLSPVAVTEPFRVLSDEGAAAALEIARDLEKIAVGDARSKRIRGCTYRSRFFDGMYRDPELVSFLATLAGPACVSTRSATTGCSSTSRRRSSAAMSMSGTTTWSPTTSSCC